MLGPAARDERAQAVNDGHVSELHKNVCAVAASANALLISKKVVADLVDAQSQMLQHCAQGQFLHASPFIDGRTNTLRV